STFTSYLSVNGSISGATNGAVITVNAGTSGNFALTVTVSDTGCTNSCQQVVTVSDTTPPIALCQDITVQLDPTGNVSITPAQIDNGSNDACGIASLSLSKTNFDCTNIGANLVTLTVTDNNGNTQTCTASVTVQDQVAPLAVCQNIAVQLDGTGNVTITPAQINNGSSDACGIASLSLSKTNFDCSNIGTNTVTLTVTDIHGNSQTCTAAVTVTDNMPPAVICSAVPGASADANCQAVLPDVLGGVTVSDSCTPPDAITLSQSPAAGTLVGLGTHVITVTATDAATNSATCTTTFTVTDDTAPTVSCPAPSSASAGTNCLAAVPDVLGGVSASDSCSGTNGITLSQSPAAGTLVGLEIGRVSGRES